MRKPEASIAGWRIILDLLARQDRLLRAILKKSERSK
jgi:hypothetical protein